MRRLGPPLLGLTGVALFMPLVGGAETGALGALAGTILIVGTAWAVTGWVLRRRPIAHGGWANGAAVAFRPAAGHTAAPTRSVALALCRVEAREMASTASLGVGLGFCLLIVVLLGQVWASDYGGGLAGAMELYPIYVHPLAGLVVLAAHRARTRSRRDGTQELFDTCATSQATRTMGHLLTSWFPAVIAVVFLAAMTALLSKNVTSSDAVGGRQIAALLGAALLCVGATALGVALARWAPWMLAPIVAVIAIGFSSTRLATAGNRRTEPIRQLSTWLNDPDKYLRFTAPHWVAHHLWMLALVGLVAVVAIARDQLHPQLVFAGSALAALAFASAIAVTRPVSVADAAAIASLINEPEAHQRCVDAAGLPVCTYGTNGELAHHIAAQVTPVVVATPPDALAGWAVRQDTTLDLNELDPEVRRLLHQDRAKDRYIPMVMRAHPQADQGARFWVGLTAAGVTEDMTPGTVLNLDHQARGVVALWLATRGVDAATAAKMTSAEAGSHESSNYSLGYDRPWPDTCYAGPAPVTWALSDLDAARQLLAAPDREVAELLRSGWARFTDPATSTDELIAAAGLRPMASRSGSTRAAGEC